MTTQAYNKPLPQPDAVSEPFWKGAKEHKLLLQYCRKCSKHIFYPRARCPYCLSSDVEWVEASGKGRVASFTTVAQAAHPGFRGQEPYICAVVKLDEGTQMFTNIVDCAPKDCKCEMPVTAVFDDVTPEITLVKFKPAK